MPLQFTALCSMNEDTKLRLQAEIHRCAAVGRSYELSCALPDVCTPSECAVGFFSSGSEYFVYFRPGIICRSSSSQLNQLFHGSPHCFPDFDSLVRYLNSIRSLLTTVSPPPLLYAILSGLERQVIGQSAATETAALFLHAHLAKKTPARPLSMILYGPTGVGKTELGKAVCPVLRQLYPQSGWQTVRTDLNTFLHSHSVSRLIGAPPGYVGYKDPAILGAAHCSPSTVFLFDELDKAHPDVLKLFMSILDEGRCTITLTDGPQDVDFRRCVFLFTTNLDLSSPRRPLGFTAADRTAENPPTIPSMQRILQQNETARRELMRSGVLREIAGRFTALIGFTPLQKTDRLCITARQIATIGREYGLHIASITPDLVAALTPSDTLSVRSGVGFLESILTPVFASRAAEDHAVPLHLSGTVARPILSKAK